MLNYLLLLFLFINLLYSKDYFIYLSDEGLKNKEILLQKNTIAASEALQKSNLLNYNFKAQSLAQKSSAQENLKRWILVSIDDDTEAFFNALKASGISTYSEPSGFFKVDFNSTDSLSGDQWYLDQISLSNAWRVTKGNESVIVAIIDTGIDYEHPDLMPAIWINRNEDLNNNGLLDAFDINNIDDDNNGYVDDVVGWDFTDAPRFADGGDFINPDNQPWDEFGSGHGTQCAGIIAAKDNNMIGITGIAPAVKIMNIRAGTASGYLEEDDVARAILYAVENGASIINMSFGDTALSRFLKDVISYAHQQGVILIASAGNSATDAPNYPASLPQVIAVGASTQNDGIAGFSNFGNSIDLVAPGVDILSTAVGGRYNSVNGTSFSAPIVAAVAALVLAEDNQVTPQGMLNLLKSSSQDILYDGWDAYSGSGRVSAQRALNVPVAGLLNIISPVLNGSTANLRVPIIGSAAHPDLLSSAISIGTGHAPEEFTQLSFFDNRQVIDDTLAVFLPLAEDTIYTIKISMELFNNRRDEIRHTFRVDRTAPVIRNVKTLPLLDGPFSSMLISFQTDDISIVEVYLRQAGDEIFTLVASPYETNNHRIKIDSPQFSGDLEFYIKAQNLSGLSSIDDNLSNYYLFSLNAEYQWTRFTEVPWSIPGGYMLDFVTDFDNDGNGEIVISRYDQNSGYGPVEIYEYNNGQFELRLQTAFRAIPRFAGDVDQDGRNDLLLGFGQNSFILEGQAINSFPTELIWQDTSGFWASAYTDLDNDDKFEVAGRKEKDWILLENNTDNSFYEMAVLPNPTAGENILSAPKSVWLDLGDDNNKEFVFGDYDGDLVSYKSLSNNSVTLHVTGKTINPNATEIISADENHLYSATHTSDNLNYEHEFDARFWTIEGFIEEELKLVSQFQINTYGFSDTRDFDSGLKISSFDDTKLMFAAFFPRLYIFQYNGNQWQPVWLTERARSNTVLVYDFDKDGNDEFYFNNGKDIVGFTKGIEERPLAPFAINLSIMDSTEIILTWQAVAGAESYTVYRGESKNNLIQISTVENTFFSDSITMNRKYYYAVTTSDSTYPIVESYLSAIDSAYTIIPPRNTGLEFKGDRQLIIYFDKPLTLRQQNPPLIQRKLHSDYASSVLLNQSNSALLTSFSKPFSNGQQDTLLLTNVFGETGVPLNPASTRIIFNYTEVLKAPYVQSVEWKNKEQLEIFFNEPMKTDGIESMIFQVTPSGNSNTITTENPISIIVTFTKDTYLGAAGKPSYLLLDGLVSERGIPLADNTKIRLFEEANGLKNIFLYPQPVKPIHDEVIFANVPGVVDIRIYNINGRLIRYINAEAVFGGISWDLRDEKGAQVTSGIYFYEIRRGNKSKQGKIAIVR